MNAALGAALRRAAVTAAAACAFVAFAAPASAGVGLVAEDDLEYAVTVRINKVRASKGLRKLSVRSALKTAATKHVSNMALNGYFSHSWSSGAGYGT